MIYFLITSKQWALPQYHATGAKSLKAHFALFLAFCLLCFSVMHTLKSIYSFSLTGFAFRLNTPVLLH